MTLIPYLTEMFRAQAWIGMGKVMHPLTGKVERDLISARQMIDLLAELETRTEGNRSENETRLLRGVLTELRLNYLDEMKKPAEEAPAATQGEPVRDETSNEENPKPESTGPAS